MIYLGRRAEEPQRVRTFSWPKPLTLRWPLTEGREGSTVRRPVGIEVPEACAWPAVRVQAAGGSVRQLLRVADRRPDPGSPTDEHILARPAGRGAWNEVDRVALGDGRALPKGERPLRQGASHRANGQCCAFTSSPCFAGDTTLSVYLVADAYGIYHLIDKALHWLITDDFLMKLPRLVVGPSPLESGPGSIRMTKDRPVCPVAS